MRSSRAFSLVETVVALAILTLLFGLATVSAVSFSVRTRMSKASSDVADALSLVREHALANDEYWMWEVPLPAVGTDVVRAYAIKRCDPRVQLQCDPDTEAHWAPLTPEETRHLLGQEPTFVQGIGIVHPSPSDGRPFRITFSPVGQNVRTFDADLRLCPIHELSPGTFTCQSGSRTRTIHIKALTGLVLQGP